MISDVYVSSSIHILKDHEARSAGGVKRSFYYGRVCTSPVLATKSTGWRCEKNQLYLDLLKLNPVQVVDSSERNKRIILPLRQTLLNSPWEKLTYHRSQQQQIYC